MDHVDHSHETDKHVNTHKVTGAYDEEEEHLPFPTLAEAFKNVSEEVGFNVEIKYPMLQVVRIKLDKLTHIAYKFLKQII